MAIISCKPADNLWFGLLHLKIAAVLSWSHQIHRMLHLSGYIWRSEKWPEAIAISSFSIHEKVDLRIIINSITPSSCCLLWLLVSRPIWYPALVKSPVIFTNLRQHRRKPCTVLSPTYYRDQYLHPAERLIVPPRRWLRPGDCTCSCHQRWTTLPNALIPHRCQTAHDRRPMFHRSGRSCTNARLSAHDLPDGYIDPHSCSSHIVIDNKRQPLVSWPSQHCFFIQ